MGACVVVMEMSLAVGGVVWWFEGVQTKSQREGLARPIGCGKWIRLSGQSMLHLLRTVFDGPVAL